MKSRTNIYIAPAVYFCIFCWSAFIIAFQVAAQKSGWSSGNIIFTSETAYEVTLDCYYQHDDEEGKRECLLTAAKKCLEARTRVPTSMTIELIAFGCYGLEVDAWEKILENEYHLAAHFFEEIDTKRVQHLEKHDADELIPQMFKLLDTFQNSHKAWKEFKQSECRISLLQFKRELAPAPIDRAQTCLLISTSERAIDLWQKRTQDVWPEFKYLE